jgi:hypothetical protein
MQLQRFAFLGCGAIKVKVISRLEPVRGFQSESPVKSRMGAQPAAK